MANYTAAVLCYVRCLSVQNLWGMAFDEKWRIAALRGGAFAFGGLGMPWGASDSYDAMVGHVSGRPSGG